MPSRVRQPNAPISASIAKVIETPMNTIAERFAAIVADLQSINFYRYSRQITSGIQEWMEAETFRHYLETQQLINFDQASEKLSLITKTAKPDAEAMDMDQKLKVMLTYEDYLLGLFDATGEMMRFAITNIATSGGLPDTSAEANYDSAPRSRTVTHDLQTMRTLMCNLCYSSDFPRGLGKDVNSKLGVMLASVEKVEKALYGLKVRGSERPKGWMPDLSDTGREVEVEA